MMDTIGRRSADRNDGAGGALAAKRSMVATSARSERSRATRSYASATIPPNTPVGGRQIIEDWEACTSVDVRLLCNSESIREPEDSHGELTSGYTKVGAL